MVCVEAIKILVFFRGAELCGRHCYGTLEGREREASNRFKASDDTLNINLGGLEGLEGSGNTFATSAIPLRGNACRRFFRSSRVLLNIVSIPPRFVSVRRFRIPFRNPACTLL